MLRKYWADRTENTATVVVYGPLPGNGDCLVSRSLPSSGSSCHNIVTGFGWVVGFIEFLQIVTTRNYSAVASSLCSSLEHVLGLLILLCLHQSLSGDRSQQWAVLPCSLSYRLATVPQITPCSNCPAYNVSAWIAQKTPFFCCCFHLLPCKHVCFRSRFSVTAVVFLLISRPC
jgi:hypothetical protein